MARQQQTQPAELAAWFLYDPTRQPEKPKPTEIEEQDAKLVYYYPAHRPLDEKRNQASLVEGLVGFTRSFSGDGDCMEVMRTQQYTVCVLEAEPDIFLVLAVKNATSSLASDPQATKYAEDPSTAHDEALRGLLKQSHRLFWLFHGSVRKFLGNHGVIKLADLLDDFVPAFLATVEVPRSHRFETLEGFHFGPVDRQTHLSILSLLFGLRRRFATIRFSALLFKGFVLASRFPSGDMRVLYGYVVLNNGAVVPDKLGRRPFGRIPTVATLRAGSSSSAFARANFLKPEEDGFVIGPPNTDRDREGGGGGGSDGEEEEEGGHLGGRFSDAGASDLSGSLSPSSSPGQRSRRPPRLPHESGGGAFTPLVHLLDGSTGYLAVLKYRDFLLLTLHESGDEGSGPSAMGAERLRELRKFAVGCRGGLAELLPTVEEQFTKIVGQPDAFRFVYHNGANGAIRVANKAIPGRSRGNSGGWREAAAAAGVGGGSSAGRSQSSQGGSSSGVQGRSLQTALTAEEARIAGRMHSLMDSSAQTGHPEREILQISVKTGASGGNWVCGRRSLEREFQLFSDSQSLNFSQMEEERLRFTGQCFSNIFTS
uniref:CCZ1/INTU/HSP4 first Longin domain-containing protein n=1 Tax=Chromera velia CCMP2878 TaxID=1169474 RepID=A0A0G4FTT6_9ALVE|eukprot:Cvel_3751.t1-p1 / transcript=Cvel_3751.t1 / gene=Cvel_3751 / organism=Chromera_velia_CCMP2878 / gene_product=Vacuolar fusion protein CCZ1 homolog, putative / transcript_product=Vacuolar fusion protein CCZ1 homolog, putative / location=Cvel_scaffold156:114708-118870(+) / protein_length=595 / sequence_SO=supercontig / SO=protein_coding / is_pseudo=false